MNIESNILIHSLDTGYIVTDNISGKRYAVESPESVLRIVGKALGIPELLPGWLIQETPAPCACMPDGIEPTKTPSPVPNILKQDILIQKFEYDHSLRKSIPGYKNTWYAELPDGRVVLGYGESSYYTTKENVLKIHYPLKWGSLKESGISTTAQICLRAYRNNLGITQKAVTKASVRCSEQKKKDEQPVSDYVSKSTQDRIKEAAERKAEHRRKKDNCKGQTEMSEKTKKLREMTIRMGIQ